MDINNIKSIIKGGYQFNLDINIISNEDYNKALMEIIKISNDMGLEFDADWLSKVLSLQVIEFDAKEIDTQTNKITQLQNVKSKDMYIAINRQYVQTLGMDRLPLLALVHKYVRHLYSTNDKRFVSFTIHFFNSSAGTVVYRDGKYQIPLYIQNRFATRDLTNLVDFVNTLTNFLDNATLKDLII